MSFPTTAPRGLARAAFAAADVAAGAARPKTAAPKISGAFNLQHWSSTKGVHPYRGTAHNDAQLCTYDGVGPQTEFYMDFQEGPWGFITAKADPRYCVHPQGGGVDADNGTLLLLHEGRHPGAYFAFNQEAGVIRHVGGRYWHPKGGSAQPGNDNGLVLWDAWNGNTRFVATDLVGPAVKEPFPIDMPAEVRLDWRLVFADDNPLTDRTHRFKKTVGLETSKNWSVSVEVTVGLEVQGKLFGAKSKGSVKVKTAYAEEHAETWTTSHEIEDEYPVKAGQPVAVWQQVFQAEFTDGSVFNFFSAKVTYDTESSSRKPPTVY